MPRSRQVNISRKEIINLPGSFFFFGIYLAYCKYNATQIYSHIIHSENKRLIIIRMIEEAVLFLVNRVSRYLPDERYMLLTNSVRRPFTPSRENERRYNLLRSQIASQFCLSEDDLDSVYARAYREFDF